MTGRDEILDTQPFTAYPVDCSVVFGNTWISCPPTQAYGLCSVVATTSSAWKPDCFDTYDLTWGGVQPNTFDETCTTPQPGPSPPAQAQTR